jgi:DNA-formamidopyrimidine glycosylase
MPEGVEVKLSAELIRPLVLDKTVYHISVGPNSRYKTIYPEGLRQFQKNCKVAAVETRGKFMYWTFDNGWYLLNTFGMSGQWSTVESKHPCLIIQFEGGAEEIIFNDPRHFGTIKFTNDSQEVMNKLEELGWDPLQQSNVDQILPWVKQKLMYSSKCIGDALMNQSIFAGVGNYIRAEALYLSGISPWRQASALTGQEVKFLCHCIVQVMQESYAHQGATILTYKTVFGAEGKYSSCFKVYGQKTDPLGNPIKKEKMPDGRAIHWSPTMQI